MRTSISFILLILSVLACTVLLASCSKDKTDASAVVGGVTAPSTGGETTPEEKTGWDYFIDVECTYHHRDFHMVPLHLVEYIGIDKASEWAKKASESLNTSAGEDTCRCPDFNIKSYIEAFDISPEEFVTYGDMVYYGTFDVDVIYGMSEEELSDYYVFSDALLDKTIASQHLQFIESHFKYEYYSEMLEMVVFDEKLTSGIYPSIPTIVQKLEIDRDSFEKILDDCTARNESVYGRSCNFEYNIDMIYNSDGTFKALPAFEGMSEFLSEMKLNRIFCGIDDPA